MLKRFLVAAALIASIQSRAYAGGFFFDAPIPAGGGSADAVEVADFNGDGRDDLAAIVYGHLEIHLQGANGVLATTPLQLNIPSTYFYGLKAADIGANGSIDILVAHSGGMAVYTWNGAGGFNLTNHAVQSSCVYLATADLNFDGAVDVFCKGESGDAMVYYSGAGGALDAPVYMLTPTSGGEVVLKDVTGDGKPDLVLVAGSSNSFFVYPHDAARGFLPGVAYPYPEENDLYASAIQVMDVDGDGSNEVIVAKPCNGACSSLLIYRRTSSGYLTLSKRIPTLDNAYGLLVADIDQDGRQDLLVGHSGWQSVGRYMGMGMALSDVEVLTNSLQTYDGSRRYALGDLDHDGFNDLAIGNLAGVSVLYGRQRAANDFDGDGVSDIWWRHATGQNVTWRSANVTKATTIAAVDPAWSIQANGDFNGYGSANVFWRNRMTGANRVRFSADYTAELAPVTSQDWQVVGAGDFGGDGRADLLWRNSRTGADTLWKSANATTWQALTTVADLHWKVVGIGDFNGDGRSDILWRNSATGADSIWRSGQSSTAQAMASITVDWQVAGVGDFNGDRRDDVLWHNVSSGLNTIWLSANSATQQGVTRVADATWTIAAIGDYNGDGRSDILWRNTTTGANAIWRSANGQLMQAVATVADLRWTIVP